MEQKGSGEGSSVKPEKVPPQDKRVWIAKSQLDQLKRRADLADTYLGHMQRLQAEFDNYRKRSLRDREEYRKFLLEDFIVEILGIIDNFERALQASEAAHDIENLKIGIELIHRQLRDLLIRRGLREIQAVGQVFDPARHEAICYEEAEDVQAHQVLEQLVKGYELHGKVIRPSQVKVAKEPSKSEPNKET